MLANLNSRDAFFQTVVGDNNQVEGEFWATEEQIMHLRKEINPQKGGIILLDATYGTTKYGWPLVNLCTMTGLGVAVRVAQAYMSNEKRSSYDWLIECFKLELHYAFHKELVESMVVIQKTGAPSSASWCTPSQPSSSSSVSSSSSSACSGSSVPAVELFQITRTFLQRLSDHKKVADVSGGFAVLLVHCLFLFLFQTNQHLLNRRTPWGLMRKLKKQDSEQEQQQGERRPGRGRLMRQQARRGRKVEAGGFVR
jgi:hypothetical protein